jgi:hypothetical protein
MSTATSQLAWAEGRRLIRNPVLWMSMLLLVPWVRASDNPTGAENGLILLVGYGLVIPSLVMVVVTVFAVLRPRLEHTEPLLATLAVGPDRRSIGHSLSTLAGGAVAALVMGALALVLARHDPLGVWPNEGRAITVPRPNVAQMLQGPMSVVVLLVFVVALVRWIPTWLVIIPITFAMLIQATFLGAFHSVATDGGRWLIPLNTGVVHSEWKGGCLDDSPCFIDITGFDGRTAWWHLGYLASLAVWLATTAVLRHRRDRVAWSWFAGSFVAVVAFAAVQFATADVYPS